MRSDTSPDEAIKESGPSADVMEVPVIDREVIFAMMWTARRIVHQWFSIDGYASADSAYLERGTTVQEKSHP